MVGRFLGSAVMAKFAPNRYLAFNALSAVALLIAAMAAGQGNADVSMWALLAVGFFNSIMFPTIFFFGDQRIMLSPYIRTPQKMRYKGNRQRKQ